LCVKKQQEINITATVEFLYLAMKAQPCVGLKVYSNQIKSNSVQCRQQGPCHV